MNYINKMRDTSVGHVYTYAMKKGVNFIFINLKDSEFFKRYGDGIPVYDDEEYMLSEYIFAHIDGPHQYDFVLTEFVWFNDRMTKGATMVFDDINDYNHKKLEEYVQSCGWKMIEKTQRKASYQKNVRTRTMKNIILQHWTGDLNKLAILSSTNILKYASNVGAEYRLLRGNVFNPNLSPPCQKLYMLNEEFDKYDIVVMIDMDVFTRKGMEENIFTDAKGVGRCNEANKGRFRYLQRKFPHLANPKYPFWGGSIYRVEREVRQRLRAHTNEKEMKQFSPNMVNFGGDLVDEGIMHRLASLAQLNLKEPFIPERWNHGSYVPGVENAATIHVRTKATPKGPKRPKIENYKELVRQGLIEE